MTFKKSHISPNALPEIFDPFNPSFFDFPIPQSSLKTNHEIPQIFKNNQVLLVSNLDSFWMDPKCLISLFSCFGNLSRMLLMKKTNKALIEYFNKADMHNAVLSIKDEYFSEVKIKVNFSKYKKLMNMT